MKTCSSFPLRILACSQFAAATMCFTPLSAATYTVVNTDNDGPGSFRESILQANASPGSDTIAFAIPGAGPHIIRPTTDLPFITDTVIIDGYTQPGSQPNSNGPDLGLNTVLQIEIDGSLLSSSRGIWFQNTIGSVVRGVAVYGFPHTGSQFDQGIRLEGGRDNVIEGCFVGTDANGTTARGNSVGINMRGSHGNLIGGDTPAARNLISGNNGIGVSMLSCSDNVVVGNLVGPDISGTVSVGNGFGPAGNVSGGLATTGGLTFSNRFGGGTPETRNIISGNTDGLAIWNGDDSIIQGNYVGTDVTGRLPLGNANTGILLRVNPQRCLVGGIEPGQRNIVSSNHRGIAVGSSSNVVVGNYVGTDVTGTSPLGNSETGILVSGFGNVIGGPAPGAGNLVANSGNGGIGILFGGGHIVQGNLVGTDASGTVPMGNNVYGVSLNRTSDNWIGGPAPGEGNVIAASAFLGLGIGSATNCVIQGNYIGTDFSGELMLGNQDRGVSMQFSRGIVLGGTSPGEGNIVVNSGSSGIAVLGEVLNASIRGNSIYNNGALGIDFYNTGPTLNDLGDADEGPNHLQNFPIVVDAAATATATWVSGVLDSTPNTEFELDFFANLDCDPSGFGEGALFLGTATVVTDSTGFSAFAITLSTGAPVGSIITATATDPAGNTSEFSPCLTEVIPGALTVQVDVKPNDYPNCFNNNGLGVIPLAILGSPDLDASLIDPASVKLEGLSVRLAGNGKKLLAQLNDINEDGFIDLVMQIEDLDGVFEPGSTIALLQGTLYDGTAIEGSDELCIVP